MKRTLMIVTAIILPGGLPLLALALWRHWMQRSTAASLLPH